MPSQARPDCRRPERTFYGWLLHAMQAPCAWTLSVHVHVFDRRVMRERFSRRATRLWGLQPDILVVGKSIGGGIPCGAYGITDAVAERVRSHPEADLVDVGGVGGTLAGNALSVAAMRATLEHVLTEDAFTSMVALATSFTEGVRATIERAGLPWTITQLGARAEYRFASPAPRDGSTSAAAGDDDLDEYLHLFMANRGVLITPFHNMALICPDTTAEDVALHTQLFGAAVSALVTSST